MNCVDKISFFNYFKSHGNLLKNNSKCYDKNYQITVTAVRDRRQLSFVAIGQDSVRMSVQNRLGHSELCQNTKPISKAIS